MSFAHYFRPLPDMSTEDFKIWVSAHWPKQLSAQFALRAGTFTNDSPGAGSVAWSEVIVEYNRRIYEIADGNTSDKWIYWDIGAPGALSASGAYPTVDADTIIVGANVSGAFTSAWKAGQGVQAEMIVGKLTADQIDANFIQVGGAAADVNDGVTTISGGKITTNSVTTSQLNFTPVQNTNVISSINASGEGITINAAKVNLTGVLQVGGAAADINTYGGGYVQTGGAAADVNNGVTTISGGKITTGTITADHMNVSTLSSIAADIGTITAGTLQAVLIKDNSGNTVVDSRVMGATLVASYEVQVSHHMHVNNILDNSGNPIMNTNTFVGSGGVNTSGAIATSSTVTATGNIGTSGVFTVDGTQVVGNQGASIGWATDLESGLNAVNAMIDRLQTHGLIAHN